MLIPAASGMVLPSAKTVAECAQYSISFEPFLPQLYALPQRIWESIGSLAGLKEIYLSTNPAMSGLGFAIALMPIFFLVAEINKNYSQVDRAWSILPTLFNLHYATWARLSGLETERVNTIFVFSLIWSARLTFNYWRKGGYEVGSEDYRWELIKKYIGSFAFLLLNVLFISTVQLVCTAAVAKCKDASDFC
jgi:steroid 5-alpha reductase family enzyme